MPTIKSLHTNSVGWTNSSLEPFGGSIIVQVLHPTLQPLSDKGNYSRLLSTPNSTAVLCQLPQAWKGGSKIKSFYTNTVSFTNFYPWSHSDVLLLFKFYSLHYNHFQIRRIGPDCQILRVRPQIVRSFFICTEVTCSPILGYAFPI